MAVPLKRLIEQVANMDISLAAGEAGLSRMVRWVHIVETVEASSFLDGGEIAFTTGIGIGYGMTLLELTESLFANQAAGLIINTGPYVENVDREVIDFGNQHDFPVFVVPWRIHIAEMIRIFSYSITKSDQRELATASAFKNAIFFPKQEELYVVALSQNGFSTDWPYCVAVLRIRGIGRKDSFRLDEIRQALSSFLCHYYRNAAVFLHEDSLLAVFADYEESAVHEAIDNLQGYLNKILRPKESVCYGVGKCTRSIRCLYKSYGQAMSVQKLQAKGKIDRSMIYYTEMGIYKLLMGIEDTEILQEYYEKTILPLVLYDQEHESGLTEVLCSYLNHDGSVKETADELFIHRNSVNYKLHKIEDILHMDLSCLDTRTQLAVGFMLQDMM